MTTPASPAGVTYRPSDRSGEQMSTWRGLAAGVLGGLVGSWIMTQFHVAIYGRGVTDTREPQSHRPVSAQDDATTKTADVIARVTTQRQLSRREKQIGGPAVHYAFGASAGALYGLLSAHTPAVQRGAGVPFGIAVWLVADEVMLPLLDSRRDPAPIQRRFIWKCSPRISCLALRPIRP
jgi:uncharacterized membrane protein YagU involved in acid resistance